LGDDQVEDGNIVTDNASTDGLALTLSLAAGSVCLVSLLHQKTDTSIRQDTLTHGETLLVVSSRDAKDVSVEFLSQNASVDFLGHAALVQVLETLFIIDIDDFLHSSARARDIDLQEQWGKKKIDVSH
jgi:hypothetical protein